MNTTWSDYVQNIGTLYFSRNLRFSDIYKKKYTDAFDIGNGGKILEIGCGPGSLTQSLSRWYPEAEIVGVDMDTAFIQFAAQQAPHIKFMEADATSLPFKDNSFDVTISNTVQEHIEPDKFFGEQLRVLKPGGVCLVLSARPGINITAPCIEELSCFEEKIWNRVESFHQDTYQKHNVGRYFMREDKMPDSMESHGFRQVSTEYLTINLTPDNPEYSREFAHSMINAHRQSSLDAVNSFPHFAPGVVSQEEMDEMKKITNQKYDKRIELYESGKKQWDTTMALTMVLRGIK